ncbi:MAG: flagellar hook-associated protein FlgK [Alicyclobacillus sp.]|nr:flagellar hook-associated protein FlgK [Alicyclobacillus sp.]
MTSTFLPLQIGQSALQAAMMGMEIAGHNVANASVPGYTRQTADLETSVSLPVQTDHEAYLGQGVNARGANRIRDRFLDVQYRENNARQSYWQLQNTELNNVEQIFNEPTGTTLRSALEGFFSAWNQLAQAPSDSGARAATYQASQSLADAFHTTANALQQEITRYNGELSASVDEVNTLVSDLARLNAQIIQAQTIGQAPNDLLDQRDALLDKLSGYAAFDVTYAQDASVPSLTHVTVSLRLRGGSPFGSSVALVTDGTVNSQLSASSPSAAGTGGAPNTVAVSDLADQGGSLSGLNDLVGQTAGVLGQVNGLALQLASSVDAQHAAGYGLDGQTNNPLFNSASLTASDAALDIAVNPAIGPSSLDLLAAASQSTAGGTNQTDGTNAQALAGQLSNYEQAYSSIVTQLGTSAQAADQQNQTFTALAQQVDSLRQSVSGVNINEEVASMIQFQQTYGAAAQFVRVFNEMLTTLINVTNS